jgi:hypothetical protein
MISIVFICLESNKAKKRKISTGDESENVEDEEEDESSSSSDNDEKKKKSKHSKKSKKKEKHRRKKEAKRLAKKNDSITGEDDNEVENTGDKNNEISGRNITSLKATIDADAVPNIPEHKFLTRPTLNDKDKNTNEETSNNDKNSR